MMTAQISTFQSRHNPKYLSSIGLSVVEIAKRVPDGLLVSSLKENTTYSGMLKSERPKSKQCWNPNDRSFEQTCLDFGSFSSCDHSYFGIHSIGMPIMPKSEWSVWISDRKYRLKPERYGSNVQISASLAFLCYECWIPNDRMNRTIQNPNKSVRTIDRSDLSIVWISDVRISAFHCTFIFALWMSEIGTSWILNLSSFQTPRFRPLHRSYGYQKTSENQMPTKPHC